jgi:hypothetical protein
MKMASEKIHSQNKNIYSTHPFVCLMRCFLIAFAPKATIWAGGSIKLMLPSSCMLISDFMPAICSGRDSKELFLASSERRFVNLSIVFKPSKELFATFNAVNPVMLCKLLGILDNKHSHNTNSVKCQQIG